MSKFEQELQEMMKSIEKNSSYNYYDKLEEAVQKNEIRDYLSSTPHYRCTPEQGMPSVNNFKCITENINCFLQYHSEYTNKFYETIKEILQGGDFYEFYSVSNIIRKQYAMQFHKMTDIHLINDDIFALVRTAIQKHYHHFDYFDNVTTTENEILSFYKEWDTFLRKNTSQHLL